MTEIGRAFVAVVPPPDVLDALEQHLEPAHESSEFRWMRRDQLHFTMQFLGRVHDAEALEATLDDSVGAQAAFAAQLEGAGAFPSPKRARVIWVGVSEGGDEFGRLARAVHAATETLGLIAEDRAFTPHMTVARSSRARAAHSALEAIGAGPIGGTWSVTEIGLFESDTRPDGAVHTLRTRIELRGSSAAAAHR